MMHTRRWLAGLSALAILQGCRSGSSAKVSELAVTQFEALLLDARGREYEVRQQMRETENRMNLLLGRFPGSVPRQAVGPTVAPSRAFAEGIPSQLLRNRPDIRQAEFELQAARFDVKAARAEFFPEVMLTAGLGLRAFRSSYLFSTPESMAYSLAGDAIAPLLNRSAIQAEFGRTSAAQRKALFAYRQRVLDGFAEVSNLVSGISNLDSLYALTSQRAETLDRSVGIASDLFNAARADYLEVLTAQREAIDAKLEVVETRLRHQVAETNLYRALGGGWK